MHKQTFAQVLGELMRARGMTNAELSRQSGVSKATITHLLSGEIKESPNSTLKKLADALGVSLRVMIEAQGYDIDYIPGQPMKTSGVGEVLVLEDLKRRDIVERRAVLHFLKSVLA